VNKDVYKQDKSKTGNWFSYVATDLWTEKSDASDNDMCTQKNNKYDKSRNLL